MFKSKLCCLSFIFFVWKQKLKNSKTWMSWSQKEITLKFITTFIVWKARIYTMSWITTLYFTLVARFGKENFGRDHKLVYVCNIIDYVLFSVLPIINVAPMGMLKLSIKTILLKTKKCISFHLHIFLSRYCEGVGCFAKYFYWQWQK